MYGRIQYLRIAQLTEVSPHVFQRFQPFNRDVPHQVVTVTNYRTPYTIEHYLHQRVPRLIQKHNKTIPLMYKN